VLFREALGAATDGVASAGALEGTGADGGTNETPPSMVLLKDRVGSGEDAGGDAAAAGDGAGARGAGPAPPNPSIVCFKSPPEAGPPCGAGAGCAGRAG